MHLYLQNQRENETRSFEKRRISRFPRRPRRVSRVNGERCRGRRRRHEEEDEHVERGKGPLSCRLDSGNYLNGLPRQLRWQSFPGDSLIRS